jgi:hypothetical protein
MFTSSQTFRGEIKNLITKYNAWNDNAILHKAKFGDTTYNPYWINYTPEHQKELMNKVRVDLLNEYKGKASTLKDNILKNRKYIVEDIGKIKFPNISSTNETTRLIGETQINSANLFLSSDKSHQNIIEAIKTALNMNRTDYAFTIADRITGGYYTKEQIENMTPEQRGENLTLVEKSIGVHIGNTKEGKLVQAINEVLTAFPGKAKLDELQTELEAFTPLEKSADSIINQLNDGRTIIQAPTIWNDLNEKERQEMIAGLHGASLVERIAFKRIAG